MTRKVISSPSIRCTRGFASRFSLFREAQRAWLTAARTHRSTLLLSESSIRCPRTSSMYLGKVIGNVVCTIKDSSLDGSKLLLVKRLPNGPTVVAVDAVGAGAGETVY